MATNSNGWTLRFEKYPGCVWIFATTATDSYGRFVGRFKCHKPATNARAFAKFLAKHFTPAEFFAARDNGIPPLTILKAKGYVSPNMRAASVAPVLATPRWVVL